MRGSSELQLPKSDKFPILTLGKHTFRLPITNVGIYRDAYHGTSVDKAERILQNDFRISSTGWYGPAIYFWLHNLRVAVWWARDKCGYRSNFAILECVVEPGMTLHAEQLWDDGVLMQAMKAVKDSSSLPKGWNNNDERSYVVYAVLLACRDNKIRVDSCQYTQNQPSASKTPVQALCIYEKGRVKNKSMLRSQDLSWMGEQS